MNKEKYHIDVTPEEDALFRDVSIKKHNFMNKKTFVISFITIFAIHILIAAAVMASNFIDSNNNKPYVSTNNSTPLSEPATSTSSTPLPTPTPSPSPIPPPPTDTSTAIADNTITSNFTTSHITAVKKPTLTTTYVVRKGDTIHSISRKFKLNVDRLIKINNLKNPDSIYPGQTLKFL